MIHRVRVQILFNLTNCLLIGQFAIHKTTAARLLHNLGPIVARDLAKAFAAINNRIVDDLRISQKEATVSCFVYDGNIGEDRDMVR